MTYECNTLARSDFQRHAPQRHAHTVTLLNPGKADIQPSVGVTVAAKIGAIRGE
jgi:hypothetical protein